MLQHIDEADIAAEIQRLIQQNKDAPDDPQCLERCLLIEQMLALYPIPQALRQEAESHLQEQANK